MILIPGYTITKLLSEGSQNTVYRGFRESDRQSVIIKLLSNEHPSKEEIDRIGQEFEFLMELAGQGTVTAFTLEKFGDRIAIIEEDGGNTLATLIQTRKLALVEALGVALKITEALEQIHQHRIIHKDINPANILCDDSLQHIKIIDFNISTMLPLELVEISDPKLMRDGTLHYISPEQTGRMNRGIDYRTDYYSLGVTFYYMLTGVLPFQAKDLAELIHAHIAKTPVPPDEVIPDLPETVSNIILKLLTKNPEERYQSTYGIKVDLQNCLSQLMNTGTIVPFQIAERDISFRFKVSEKIYGREKELKMLQDAYKKVLQGSAELITISGYSGVGKSSLVNALYQYQSETGYFIKGKFDQFKRNIPYTAITQAFQLFVQQIITENEKNVEIWRDKILKAVGINGRLLTDFIPILTSIIGEQPPLAALEPKDAEMRFKLVFKNMIHAIASETNPLIIFLDDWQWADSASLSLLELLALDPESHHLMILVAYRDSEVDNQHVFMNVLKKLMQESKTFQAITVSPLDQQATRRLIADTLHQQETEVQIFSDLCYEKTQGNPFFLNEFLHTLYLNGLLIFNSIQGKWTWDIEKIKNKDMTNNVVELMTQRIQRLPSQTQQILALAACLGNRFKFQDLVLICEQENSQSLTSNLKPVLQEGLLILEGETYHFAHDRIQQAAYQLLDEFAQKEIHLKIGRIFLKNTPSEKLNDSIFEIVSQMNDGIELISDPEEKHKLSELNLLAAKKAIDTFAFKPAFNYLKAGIVLLDENCWQEKYDLSFELHSNIISVAFVAGEFAEIEKYSKIALENCRDILDKVKIHDIGLIYLFAQQKFKETLSVGFTLLDLFGLKLTRNPKVTHILFNLLYVKWLLRRKTIEDLTRHPNMTSKQFQALTILLSRMQTIAFVVNPKLMLYLNLKIVELSLLHGHSVYSSAAYIMYANVVISRFKQVDWGYQLGKFALKLVDTFNSIREQCSVGLRFSLLMPWKEDMNKTLEAFEKIYQKGLELNNEYIVYAKVTQLVTLLFAGRNLQKVIKETEDNNKYIAKHTLGDYATIGLQAMQNLTSFPSTTISGKICNEESYTSKFITNKNYTGILCIYHHKLLLALIFKKYEEAYIYGQKCIEYISSQHFDFLVANIEFLSALSYLKKHTANSIRQDKHSLKKVAYLQKNMQFRAKNAPSNYLNKYYLVEAELARLADNYQKAADYYEKAIKLAKENGFLSEEAMANEFAADFYGLGEKEKISLLYLREANYCYEKWGAYAKVEQLKQEHPDLNKESNSYSAGTTTTLTTDSTILHKIDLSTTLKAAQTITSEIELSNLLQKMMRIMIENAGAQNGFLLLKKSDQWCISAESHADDRGITILQSESIVHKLPVSIISYVVRSKSPIAIANATQNEQFCNDLYIKEMKPKSILCMPLLNQGSLSAILYLENNLITNVFTPDRLELLSLLSAQVVAALDNAKLYSDLKTLNARLLQLNKSYESFVPKEFLNLLGKNDITSVTLGDQVQQEMTVMFCDIRNFTTISENLTPEQTMAFVNQFLSKMEPVITKNNGVIDKYIGDAIMALFPKSADDAVTCAIEMLHELQLYNKRLDKPINIGIGLNTGLLVLGTIGTPYRMEGTVLSDAVNIASRTETLNKTYHTNLLITHDTYKKLVNPSKFFIRKIDNIVFVKGKRTPIKIYEIFDNDPEEILLLKQKSIVKFEKAVDYFWKGEIHKSLQIFNRITKANPHDLGAQLYIKRCNQQSPSTN